MSATVAVPQTARHAEASARGPGIFDILPLPAPAMSIFSSRLCLPGLLTALVACLLYFLDDNPPLYFRVVGCYIVLMIVTIFYQNSMLRNRLLSLVFVAAAVAAILWINQILDIFFYVFRTLPGLPEPTTQEFGENFIYYFVSAGLMEELIKAVPTLVGLCIFLVASMLSRGRSAGWLVERFGVATPMQGLMMGIAAGGAFTLIETLEQYVPSIQAATANEVAGIIEGALLDATTDPKMHESLTAVIDIAAEKTGLVSGFFLLMPRTLGALIGHMSYAGIFGYFIGLAGLYRGAWTVPLLIIGWLLSSAIHGAWNAAAAFPYLLVATGIMSFVIFFTYYLKALPESPGVRVASRQ
jgi:RsiW-degrading membrane proteinase PrsW (M82 family)